MANGTITLTATDSRLAGKIEWRSSSNGSIANTSNVTATLYIKRTDTYTTTGTWSGQMEIAGDVQSFNLHTDVSSSWVKMISFSKTVTHNNDGSGSCWISGYCDGPTGTTMAGEGVTGNKTVTLDKIPRYLTITDFKVQTKQINKVVIKWAVSDPRSDTYYSLNGGNWIGSATHGENVSSDNKSGTFNISELAPNTTYKLKLRCKRADSGLTTESNEISFTTYDYAKITTVSNFNFGDKIVFKKANPSSASNSIKIVINNTTITTRTLSTDNVEITLSQAELDNLYKKLIDNKNATLNLNLITTQNSKTYTHIKGITCTMKGNQATAHIRVNSSWKRGKVWIRVNSSWKRGLIWVKVNNSWRRCI